LRHRPLAPGRPRPHAQRPDGALHRERPAGQASRRARSRARQRRPGRDLSPALRPRGRRAALPEIRARCPEGRVRLRSLPGLVLRELLLPQELRAPGLPLAAPGRRQRADARRDRAAHRRPHAGPPLAARRAARDRAGHPGRRRLLLAGAHRQGTGTRRRLEPDAGTPLDQEAEDDRPADGRPHLSGSRPELLGNGEAPPGRVPLRLTRRQRDDGPDGSQTAARPARPVWLTGRWPTPGDVRWKQNLWRATARQNSSSWYSPPSWSSSYCLTV